MATVLETLVITALQQPTMIKSVCTNSFNKIDWFLTFVFLFFSFPALLPPPYSIFLLPFLHPASSMHFLLLFLLISLLCVAVGIIRSMAKFALVMQATLSSPRFPPFLFLLLFLLFFFHFLYLDTFLLLLLLLFLLMPILLLHRYLPHILPPLLQTSPCLIDRIHFSARMTKMATVGEMHATWIEISK